MQIQILGCYGGQLPRKRLTSFLINGDTLIDAGGVTEAIGIPEQNAIKNVIVSHAHLDHIKDIPMLADNVIGMKPFPVNVISHEHVINTLKNHVMNNSVWPDFTVIPSKEKPVLAYRIEKEESVFEVGPLKIEFVKVKHPVPTCGMFISQGNTTLLYTADSGPTERIWERAQDYKKTLKAVILETSFPNKLAELSLISGHLSPCHLPAELAKLGATDAALYLYHFKPAFENDLKKEVKALKIKNLRPLEQGETIQIG